MREQLQVQLVLLAGQLALTGPLARHADQLLGVLRKLVRRQQQQLVQQADRLLVPAPCQRCPGPIQQRARLLVDLGVGRLGCRRCGLGYWRHRFGRRRRQRQRRSGWSGRCSGWRRRRRLGRLGQILFLAFDHIEHRGLGKFAQRRLADLVGLGLGVEIAQIQLDDCGAAAPAARGKDRVVLEAPRHRPQIVLFVQRNRLQRNRIAVLLDRTRGARYRRGDACQPWKHHVDALIGRPAADSERHLAREAQDDFLDRRHVAGLRLDRIADRDRRNPAVFRRPHHLLDAGGQRQVRSNDLEEHFDQVGRAGRSMPLILDAHVEMHAHHRVRSLGQAFGLIQYRGKRRRDRRKPAQHDEQRHAQARRSPSHTRSG